MSFILPDLQIREIRSDDYVNKFSLGEEVYTPLKIFLRKAALNFHQYNIAKTYVLIDELFPRRVFGYITLMNSEIILNEKQRPKEIYMPEKYDSFPAVKIGRLAIDKTRRGKGYGKDFLEWAINLVRYQVALHVGCRFLVVDSKPESIDFYRKAGFQFLSSETSERHPAMYLDLFHLHHKESLCISKKTGEEIEMLVD